MEDGVKTAIILLAAGNSSRLGSPKQELLIRGKPLLTHSIQEAVKSEVSRVVVVLGYEEKRIRKLFPEDPKIVPVVNDGWSNGMGASIKAGVNYLVNSKEPFEALILSVCDQPYLMHHHYNAMIDSYRSRRIVASRYGNKHSGVPVLFCHHYFSQLLKIDDSQGAKPLLQSATDRLFIEFSMGEFDMDTKEDYERFMGW